jgi:hypothetical protein
MHFAHTGNERPRTTSHPASCPPSRAVRLREAVRSAVAGALIASVAACGEPAAPESDALMMIGYSDVFELDSLQLGAAFSRKPTLPPESVSWSLSGDLATVSRAGVVTAIRAIDFDRPADPLSSRVSVTATVGSRTVTQTVSILGWQKPLAPELDRVAYMSTKLSSRDVFGGSFAGIDEAGEPYGGWGSLVLTCGTVVAGNWTVEIDPNDLNTPWIAPTRKLFSTDTVSVAFDGAAASLERWQRVGLRLRVPDGNDMVRRLLRGRTLRVVAQSYSPNRPAEFVFRLGNVQRVTQAAAFRACN